MANMANIAKPRASTALAIATCPKISKKIVEKRKGSEIPLPKGRGC